MKIAIGSDFHTEFGERQLTFDDPPEGIDVLILAGDIGVGIGGLEWAAKYTGDIEHLIYVAGNHEFYNYEYPTLYGDLKKAGMELGIEVLENDTIEIDDYSFIGATLWTDYLFEKPDVTLGKLMSRQAMNDYRVIMGADPDIFEEANRISREFIDTEIKRVGREKSIVITHHAPVGCNIHPVYHNDPYNMAFMNGWDNWVAEEGPAIWVHGHVHYEVDSMVGETRIICNPRGYGKERLGYQQDPFEFKVIEV